MMSAPLDLVVDDRERSRALLATLESMPEVIVTRRRMEVGMALSRSSPGRRAGRCGVRHRGC